MLTSPSGKSYIGQTKRPIEERFKEHQFPSSRCVAIYNAIRKYGWESFKKHWYEVPDEELNAHEELMVEVLGTLVPDGYNLVEGGGAGGKPCEESRKKMSESKKSEKNPMFGKILPDEVKQKMSESHKGKTLSDEHKQQISDSMTGDKNHMFGKTSEDHPRFGKTHTDDTRRKMSKNNHMSKKVYQYDINGTFIQSFASCEEAAWSLNKKCSNNISRCASGKRPIAYGFKWSYTEL